MPATSFPTSERDVSGIFVLGMARALAARGHEIEVLAPAPAEGEPWTAPAPGVRVRWLRYARPRALQRTFHRAGAPDNLARDPLAWIGAASFPLALAAALRARRWDAIASHWGVPCGLVAAGLRGRARHVAFFHSADVHALTRAARAGRAMARAISAGSDELVFVSDALRERFLELAPRAHDRAHVMAMGVDSLPPLDRDQARASLGLDRLTLLALARLVPVKGLDVAIEALAGRDDVELVVAGEGPERARLEQLARARRVRVRFLGVITGEAKSRWLAAADALVAPSVVLPGGRSEGAPVAVLEAMGASKPVIASAAGGLAELVVHDETGLLVPPRDAAALRAAIERLRSDPSLAARLGERASLRARERTWTALAPRVEGWLRARCARPPQEDGSRTSPPAAAGSRPAP